MRPTAPQRQDVMHFRGFGQPSFLTTLFAQRVRCQKPGAYPFPFTAGVQFSCRLVSAVPVVLPVSKFLMLFAVPSFRQPGTAWVAARPLGFTWQCPSPPNLVYNVASCPMLCRNLLILSTTQQLARCCPVIRQRCWQDSILPNVMPAFAQLVGNISTFPGIEKAHGRFALPRAAPYFAIIILPQV